MDPSVDLDTRIQMVARQLRRLFEAITPIRRATMFDEHSSPEMAEGLRRSRTFRRNHVAAAFIGEVGRGAEDRILLDALDLATSWQSWYYLRLNLGRSAGAAEKVIILSMHQILTGGRPATAAPQAAPASPAAAARAGSGRAKRSRSS